MGNESYDVVVVGAGIVGVNAAYRLAAENARVALLDAGLSGRATAAGAGIISPVGLSEHETSPAWTTLVSDAISYYHALLAELGDQGFGDTSFARVGQIVLAGNDDEVRELERLRPRLDELAANGSPLGEIERLSGREIAQVWPHLRPDLEGLRVSNVARVDGRRIRDVVEQAAIRRGAQVLAGRADVGRDGRLVVDGSRVSAGTVILATGAWSMPALKELGVAVGVSPDRGQIVHLQVPGTDTSHYPVVNTFAGHYMLGFPDAKVVVGATHEPEAGFDEHVTAGAVHSILQKTLRVAPGLAGATLVETRVGFRPESSDSYPLLGRPPGIPNVVIATGCGAWGLTLGPLLGDAAARQALGRNLSVDLTALAPTRAVPASDKEIENAQS